MSAHVRQRTVRNAHGLIISQSQRQSADFQTKVALNANVGVARSVQSSEQSNRSWRRRHIDAHAGVVVVTAQSYSIGLHVGERKRKEQK